MLPFSNLALSGAFDITTAVLFYMTLYIELLLTVILHVDIVNTIKNPLKRGKNLQKLRWFGYTGVVIILLICAAGGIEAAHNISNYDELLLEEIDIDW